MATAAAPFEIDVQVQAEDVDGMGHVNNIVYVRWIQEVALAHWFAHAPADARDFMTWVVLRHEIDYLRPARPGDALRARTWIGEGQSLRYERFTEIARADGTVLARARSVWCPVDTTTGRPRRVPPEVREAFSRA
ncbi:thioesterase family protein [Longimicrobium sp.]|uniref:acyl-CoA thioesterase n=1 Tax=Longimicrobium sp. TaxID=2029185 RepID=UPI002E2F096D|nr:thioesterase family protein [Longimicrobium sp.]HEX6042612.1 thioesterase family protein [Longimicrobium sp.]